MLHSLAFMGNVLILSSLLQHAKGGFSVDIGQFTAIRYRKKGTQQT